MKCLMMPYGKSQFVYSYRNRVVVRKGFFSIETNIPRGLVHVVFNFIEPYQGLGFRIYHDGVEVGSDTHYTELHGRTFNQGDGRIVVGRYRTGENNLYSSLKVDEMLLFNKALSSAEIKRLSH